MCPADDEIAHRRVALRMVRVLTVGPNAGLQKVLTFPTLEVGGVNRASHVTSYCGARARARRRTATRCPPTRRASRPSRSFQPRFESDQIYSIKSERVLRNYAIAASYKSQSLQRLI